MLRQIAFAALACLLLGGVAVAQSSEGARPSAISRDDATWLFDFVNHNGLHWAKGSESGWEYSFFVPDEDPRCGSISVRSFVKTHPYDHDVLEINAWCQAPVNRTKSVEVLSKMQFHLILPSGNIQVSETASVFVDKLQLFVDNDSVRGDLKNTLESTIKFYRNSDR